MIFLIDASEHRQSQTFKGIDMTLDERITFNAEQCGGRPCIRGMRIRVADVLEMLAQGMTEETILADFPDLEQNDIRACLHFAAQRSGIARLAA